MTNVGSYNQFFQERKKKRKTASKSEAINKKFVKLTEK